MSQKTTPPHWMNPDETRAFETALGQEPETALAPGRKISPYQKTQRLLDSCRAGNTQEALEWIREGADPNSAERGYPHNYCLDLALLSRNADCSFALIERGALTKNCHAFIKTPIEGNGYDGNAKKIPAKEIPARTISLLRQDLAEHASVALIERYCALLASKQEPIPSNSDWARHLISAQHPDKLLDFCSQRSFELDGALWSSFFERCSRRILRGDSTEHSQARESALSLLRAQGRRMSPKTSQDFFGWAIEHDDGALLETLLRAGLRASPDWSVTCPTAEPGYAWRSQPTHGPILAAALSCGSDGKARLECYSLLKRFSPVIEAAKAFGPVNPRFFANLQVGQILEADALGINIEGADANGDCFLHLWAQVDSKGNQRDPRAGWSTLARKKENLLSLRNKKGETPLSLQMSLLKAEKAEAFSKLFARGEASAMRQSVAQGTEGKPKTKRNAPTRL